MENFFFYLLPSDDQRQNTHRHKVLKTLEYRVSWLCCLNKTHPEGPTFPVRNLTGSQQSTSANKHNATRFYFPKKTLFLICIFHSIPSRALRRHHTKGNYPREPPSLCAALQKGKQRWNIFFGLFLGAAKLPCSESATPIQERGLCAACARSRSAAMCRKWSDTSTYSAVSDTATTSVLVGDRHEHVKPDVLDPYPKAEKLFIIEPSYTSQQELNRNRVSLAKHDGVQWSCKDGKSLTCSSFDLSLLLWKTPHQLQGQEPGFPELWSQLWTTQRTVVNS